VTRVADVLVVGGGIAGLSAAAALAGNMRVVLLEREALLATHASGRNAAIFRPLEMDASTVRLAQRSLAMYSELSETPLLRRTGLLLGAAMRKPAQALLAHAQTQGLAADWLEGEALRARAPSLAGGSIECGVFLSEGGVLDVHALTTALARAARARGAEVRSAEGVATISVERGRAVGAVLSGGERVAANAVVLAAGAWAAALGAACGAPLPLTSLRRHLIQLDVAAPLEVDAPVVWRIDDDELYYRAESGGVLASACDQVAWQAGTPPADPAVLETLAHKLARSAPGLAGARVRRFWACLRTFAPDRELVVGADPRIAGLYWFTGLGGRGLGVAPAAAELLATSVREQCDAWSQLSPARLCAASSSARPS
jgi:D-arginine dehydrogenase